LLSMGTATAKDSVALATEVGGQVGTGSYTFKEGQEFTVSILGVGWTQLDNTLAVDYDNSYIGYGCGFHSNGYMAVHLTATGGPASTSSTSTRCCTRVAERGHLLRHGAAALR